MPSVSAAWQHLSDVCGRARSSIGSSSRSAITPFGALPDFRDFHSREARQVVPLAKRADLDRSLDDQFQEMTELVKGLAVLGELTPRSIDAISSYGERLSSYVVSLAFEHFGVPSVHVD